MKDPEIKISPPGSILFNLQEIWANRELIYFFAWRDVKVKYKQTYLGIIWVLLQPLLLTGLFYLLFYRKLNISADVPYPLYAFTGLICWILFSSGITNSSESLINNAQIIRKIYFPRIIIPLASLLTGLLDFILSMILFLLLLLIFRQSLSWHALYCFPLAVIFIFASSFGMGSLIAALNIKYRDFRYLLPFGIQLLFLLHR